MSGPPVPFGRAAFGIALAIAAGLGTAQTAPPTGAATRGQSAAHSGADIANRGITNVPACVSCHGAAGEGNAQTGFPRLSGQPASYLARQLDAYADGRRPNPVMTPIATALNSAQRGSVAAHYAAMGATGPTGAAGGVGAAPTSTDAARAVVPASAASAATVGQLLALQGDDARIVQACRNCHGPDGIGEPNGYPSLAGQHASYLQAAMKAWQDGSRKTDPTGSMPHIAAALAPDEVQAVVSYYSALSPAAAPVDRLAAPSRAAVQSRRTIVSGPTRRAPAADTGTGTEHGGPVNGGSQGPGGTPPNAGAGNRASGPR